MLNRIRAFPLSSYWRDIAWQASGNSLAQLVGILGIPILSRLYSPEDFGLQSLFVQVSVFAAGLMTLRYEYFIQLPKTEAEATALVYLVLMLGTLTTLIITPITWVWRSEVAGMLGDIKLATWLGWAPITSFLISWALVAQHRTQRRRDYRSSGISELVGKTSYIGSGLLGALLSQQPGGLIAATACSALGKIAWLTKPTLTDRWYNSISWIHNWRQHIKLMIYMARQYRHLSGSMVMSHLLSTCTGLIPIIAIVKLYGSDVLGQYALVMATVFLPSGLIGTAIGQVYYQSAAADWAANKSISPLWYDTATKLVIIGAPIYTLIAVLAPYAYPFLFGKAWVLAGNIAPMIAIVAFFSFLSGPMDRSSLIVGAWWYLPIWHTFRVFTIGCTTVLVWQHNLNFEAFLWAWVLQHCFFYFIDLIAGFRFSRHLSIDE